MPLPLFPIGTQPFNMSAAEASKQRGIELFFLLIVVFLVIEDEDENKCNPLLTTVLDSLVLIGLATIITANAPACPPNSNPPPQPGCRGPGKCGAGDTAVYTKHYEPPEEPAEPEKSGLSESPEEADATALAASASEQTSNMPQI